MDGNEVSDLLEPNVDHQALNISPLASEVKSISANKCPNKKTVRLAGTESLTHVPVGPQQVGTLFAFGAQQGLIQPLGIPIQHMPRQAPTIAHGRPLVQSHAQNGNMFGSYQRFHGAHFVPSNKSSTMGHKRPANHPGPSRPSINKQFGQIQLGAQEAHALNNWNRAAMIAPNQQYPVQLLSTPGTAVQFVSGPAFTGIGGQVIYLSPGQGYRALPSAPPYCLGMPSANHFVAPQSMGPPCQSPRGHGNHSASNHPAASATANNIFCPNTGVKQSVSCHQGQNKLQNPFVPVPLLKPKRKQPRAPGTRSCAALTDNNSGNKYLKNNTSAKEAIVGSQEKTAEVEECPRGLKRPATKQLTREALLLHQLYKDQERSVLPDKGKFLSLEDAAQRLLPYHVFQGSLPTEEDLHKVDTEFESSATHLLKKAQAMQNKYRLLLIDDAMRINNSAEMLMLERMFNQEERDTLRREKQMASADPDGYLAEFCCATQYKETI
ncbi:BRD4-interacting chromatin-remodeling complex-associated protein-like [Pseudophryne corroboree]|uniref:BRD4-interacting chromatin-remodeling complex-associated protein-like n=1 Tax=Pseudophryne corroboree TaxID=495146 RepID=UPI0030814FF0